MANQNRLIFLEEWLRSSSGSDGNVGSSRQSSPSSARAIIQAWADLRSSLQQLSFHQQHLQSLNILLNSRTSLYVADPQAKLLLSILSSSNLSLPGDSYPLFFSLLYLWIRKSSIPSLLLIDSAVDTLSSIFSVHFDSFKSPFFFSQGVLLLGALSAVPSLAENSKRICLELLCKLLEEDYNLISSSGTIVSSVLAGIGYALSSCGTVYFVRILDSLFEIWNKKDGPSGSISCGLMILHLTEWIVSNFINLHSQEKINLLIREIFEIKKPTYALFAIVMAAGGSLRASGKFASSGLMPLRVSAQKLIEAIADDLISVAGNFINSVNQPLNSLLRLCISLAVARSGTVTAQPALLLCLASSLLTEIFPLPNFCARILGSSPSNLAELRADEVKQHLDSVIFKEAGAITGVFCNHYVLADEGNKNLVENLIWMYCQDVYSLHRKVALILRGCKDELLGDLEKIAESSFLMVVLFALAVTKHRLDAKFNQDSQLEISVKILVAFSCMEYFRRMRLAEYMDTIRGVVVSVQEIESACVLFVESMPSYFDLTNQHVTSSLQKMEYVWSEDEVQTARVLFYLRVISTCIERLPASIYRKVVAPTMFLYMGHPNGKVARTSHSMFTAFLSSEKDSDQDEQDLLKEQLVFYYIQRSLEGYPGNTPFEGMASGVAALVRHLPAGSPSIFYSIDSIADKVSHLCYKITTQEVDKWKRGQNELEPCKKLLELLLRLLSLVDIQVLPHLMKLLAQLIVQLPEDGQDIFLNELYVQVAESDDVTRKPALVSWLQSLSYLCSQVSQRASKQLRRKENDAASSCDADTLNMHGMNARL